MTTTRTALYLRNRRSRVIHKNPTRELCNWDAVPQKYRQRWSALVILPTDRLCAYCFREETPEKP